MKKIFQFCLILISQNIYASEPSNERCQTLLNDISPKISSTTSQVLVVQHTNSFYSTMTACQRHGLRWSNAFTTMPTVLGKNGITENNSKKEGDLKTPRGLYPIGETFSFKPKALKMDHRLITSEDKFVDDIESPQYNSWVVGNTNAKSYESMMIKSYELGAVINYNMAPAIPGKGSAIFLHIWSASNKPTAGCVAMSKDNMQHVLKWLDKNKHPFIYVK